MSERPQGKLRRGWTTGACATAATRAAYAALLGEPFPDPVTITLPRGQRPAFALAQTARGEDWARAAIVKDAGDDPDVTHQALVLATVRRATRGSGVHFVAGEGVGTVTRPGLPLAVGEAAINPVPRAMMRETIAELAGNHGECGDIEVEIGVENGAELARHTWNPRLGIVGGLSILGTTGIVIPYSCSAWIHSIRQGVDVARACGLTHVAGCTGKTSERTAQALYDLPEQALLDMGDFAGGLLKYLRDHPLPRLTIAGGFAKLCKLARGHLDLHSGRSQVDREWLAEEARALGAGDALCARIRAANTAGEVRELAADAGLPLAARIAAGARRTADQVLRGALAVDVLVVDRRGNIIGRDHG